ncbi:MAG: VCBS repeat-containing protein, partial [Bacteroidetes bacterium]|nr:VCBS repeat-containing protein [Bacteroidota bacterium]
MPYLRLPLLTILFVASLSAQSWIKIDSVFSPFGVTAENFSAPEYCDLDGDGDLDLIVGSTGNRIEYFKNIGNKTSPTYRKDTTMFSFIYENGYQFTNASYPALVDLDNDNDYDLIIGGFTGLHLYWNLGDSTTVDWLRDSTFFNSVNAQIGSDAEPAFADLDGDGDQDLVCGIGESLLGGPTPGIFLAFRNVGNAASPLFSADNSLITGIPDVGLNAYPAFCDLDKDGDQDLVIGRDLQSLLVYKNNGTAAAPVWVSTNGLVSPVEVTTYWKNPVLADLDGDGDPDLTYGTSDGTIKYYRNIGTASSPTFQVYTAFFQMIRTDGNAANVSIADFDKDKDLDFISGDWLGGIQYFRNDGDSIHPNFIRTTSSFTSLDAGSYSTPVFVDIDKDGDQDIVSGELLGTLRLWINNNGTFSANTTMFAGIDCGYRSAPAFTDIDNDGDLDMLLGSEESAQLKFYKNNGANVFTPNDTLLAGIGGTYVAYPTFVDLDKDGDMDLAVGGGFGDLFYYENTGTPNAPVWSRNDARMYPVEVRQGAAAGFADFDGDGRADMIIGQYNGNFTFYKNAAPASVRQNSAAAPGDFRLLQNYPNPFNPSTTIQFTLGSAGQTTMTVHDLLGRTVAVLHNGTLSAG